MDRSTLDELLFHIACRRDGVTYWFPRKLDIDITYQPTAEEVRTSTQGAFMKGVIRFTHGLLLRRRTELGIFRVVMWRPTGWQWASDGAWTPGFLFERLEGRWFQRRLAMNVSLTSPASTAS